MGEMLISMLCLWCVAAVLYFWSSLKCHIFTAPVFAIVSVYSVVKEWCTEFTVNIFRVVYVVLKWYVTVITLQTVFIHQTILFSVISHRYAAFNGEFVSLIATFKKNKNFTSLYKANIIYVIAYKNWFIEIVSPNWAVNYAYNILLFFYFFLSLVKNLRIKLKWFFTFFGCGICSIRNEEHRCLCVCWTCRHTVQWPCT